MNSGRRSRSGRKALGQHGTLPELRPASGIVATHATFSAITDGQPSTTPLAELDLLGAPQEEIERALRMTPSAPAPLIHPNVSEIHAQKVAELHRLMENLETRGQRSGSLPDRRDRPHTGRGRIANRSVRRMAAILGLCQFSKTPVTEIRDGLEQMELVAGAGLETATLVMSL